LKVKFIIPFIAGFTLPLVLLLTTVAVAEGPLIQVLEKGCINWSTSTAMAKGIGTPGATDDGKSPVSPADVIGAARINAQANLMETISAIRINAVSRVADRMAQDPAFSDGLISLVQNATITHQEYLSDGTVEIELTMKLSGGFAQFVLPEEIRQVDSITATTGVTELPPTPSREAEEKPYTGLIVDAVGIGAKPSLVPLVVDESGEAVYGPAFVSREFAVSRGMSGFAATLEAARDDKRVGDRPMIVKAIRTHFTGETDLVISNTDAARLRSSVVYLNFLKACQVNIVLDSEAGS
jgi:hypothetical protein